VAANAERWKNGRDALKFVGAHDQAISSIREFLEPL